VFSFLKVPSDVRFSVPLFAKKPTLPCEHAKCLSFVWKAKPID